MMQGLIPKCLQFTRSLNQKLLLKTTRNSMSTNMNHLLDIDYIPRKAVLYVPGSDIRKLNKIPTLKADCIVLDCEDGVAYSKKEEARENISKMLGEIDFGSADCTVRVNSISSGMTEKDLRKIITASHLPQTLLLPKVDYIQEVEEFTSMFEEILNQYDIKTWKPALITSIETSIGLLNLQAVLQRFTELSQTGCHFYLDGVLFGSDDFCADIGASRTRRGDELMYARQKVVTTAKAFRLQVIDMVDIDYKDLDTLKELCEEGARMGFTGKQVIHPSQIPIVQLAFSPSPEKVAWATELINKFEEHQLMGKGAFTYHGQMIDMPLLLQAKNIVKMSK
ncbi:citramalyl-CoA lyase, mitochondrial-like [Argonauta hians]